MKKPTFSISNALFAKVTRAINKTLGAMLFGPPKLLGLPENIWSGGRITGNDSDEMQSLRRAYFYNRVRVMTSRVYMIMSLPLAIAAAVIVFGVNFTQFVSASNAVSAATSAITPLMKTIPGVSNAIPSAPRSSGSLGSLNAEQIADAQAKVDAFVAKHAQDSTPAQLCEKLSTLLNVANRSADAKAPFQSAKIREYMTQFNCGGN